jgi:hypothetical protein
VAYETTWGVAKRNLKYCIQVKSPPRGPRTKVGEDNASVFEDNWVQQVIFDLVEFPSEKTTSVKTTQGRLYSCLRFGELKFIEPDSSAPNRPKLAQEMMTELGAIAENICATQKARHLFIMPFDMTNSVLRVKLQKIERSLCGRLKFEPKKFNLSVIDSKMENKYTATTEVLCLKINNGGRSEVEAALKEALYTPAKNKITDVERFNLLKHGILLSN